MKALVTIFFIAVLAVLYSMITINIDLCMWSALIGDIAGISAIVYSCRTGKSIV